MFSDAAKFSAVQSNLRDLGVVGVWRGYEEDGPRPNWSEELNAHARGKQMSKSYQKMTSARKQEFLDELALHGLVTIAAKKASPHSKNGCHVSFYEERSRDSEFAEAWDKALEIADEVTISEIRRRGIEGYESPVWGSLGERQGTGQVGTEIKYSDKMAELFARIQSLRVRQALTNKVEMSGTVKTETKLDLRTLSPEKRALLEKLLEPEDPAE